MKRLAKLFLKLTGRGMPSPLSELPIEKFQAIEGLIADLRARGLTYVGPKKLQTLAWAALTVGDRGILGDFVEAGVALGGSAILLGKLKPQGAALRLFDVFGQIPPPGPNDGTDAHERYAVIASGKSVGIDKKTYYGYVHDLQTVVRNNLASYGITPETSQLEITQGLFEDALLISQPVALAHVDCDWYDSVKICINRIYPQLSLGGLMIFDDYKSYSGCRRAVDEWLAAEKTAGIVSKGRSVAITRLS
jgi:hypothetical protein